MRKFRFIMVSLIITILCVGQLMAQKSSTSEPAAKQQKQEQQPIQQPAPKKTGVKYAPNAQQPSVQQQIETLETSLTKLRAIPAKEQSTFIKNKITRLEAELKQKKKQAKALQSAQPANNEDN